MGKKAHLEERERNVGQFVTDSVDAQTNLRIKGRREGSEPRGRVN